MNFISLKNNLFDFFLPRFCPGCNSKLEIDSGTVCSECLSAMHRVTQTRLIYEYDKKFAGKKLITDFISLYEFEKGKELQNILHSFKYQNRFLIGRYFGQLLYSSFKEKIDLWKIDFLIAVPLHHLKKAERGYNQSDYIVKGISSVSGIRVKNFHLRRQRYTESQTTKTKTERMLNMADAFKPKKVKQLINKRILLVDDVITTGATISECAKALSEKGVDKIFAASIAIA